MAETAAHLVDHVFPPLPVCHWVLSVPKRLRWYLERVLFPILIRKPPAILAGNLPPAMSFSGEAMG